MKLIGHAFEVFGIGDDIRMAARALQAAAVACCVIHHPAAGAALPLQVVPMAATAWRSRIWSDRQPRSGGAGWVSGAVFPLAAWGGAQEPRLVLTYYLEAGSGYWL